MKGERWGVGRGARGVVRTSVTLQVQDIGNTFGVLEVTSFGWSAQFSVEYLGRFFLLATLTPALSKAASFYCSRRTGFCGRAPSKSAFFKPHF